MQLVPCRGCGTPVSVEASGCPRCGQPAVGKPSSAAKVAAGAGALCVGLYGLSMLGVLPHLTASPSAYVECRGAGITMSDGMACTVEHRSGSERANVCWDVVMECSNGTRGTARGCGEVLPGGKVSVAVPFAAFGNTLKKCDRVTMTSVAGVTLR